jgi:DNA-binding CsgD family transcriptional regulator
MACLQNDSYADGATADKRTPIEFGADLLKMAHPKGVGAVAIGGLPAAFPTSPLHEGLPIHLCTSARRAFGRFAGRTHFFSRSVQDPDEVRHVVCDAQTGRDGEILRAGAGLSFVVDERDGRRQGVIFFGAALPRDEACLWLFALTANYAYTQMLSLEETRPGPSLSDRQREVLAWAADGKTDAEIAVILGLSGHTVDKYMRQIKDEMVASNRTAAIVTAIRCGLIS